MAKKEITEAQLGQAVKAGYSKQQIASELNKYEKNTWNDVVYSWNMPWQPTSSVVKTDYMAQRKKNAQMVAETAGTIPPTSQEPLKPVVNENTMDTSTGLPVSESPKPQAVVPEPLKTTPTVNDWVVTPVEQPVKETTVATPTIIPQDFTANNIDEAFQILQKGGKLANTKQNAIFSKKYDNYQKINALSANSLADMNVRGLIDTETMNRLSQLNPQKWSEVDRLTNNGIEIDNINQSAQRLFNSTTGDKTTTLTKSEQLQEDLSKEVYAERPSLRDRKDELLNWNQKIKDLSVKLATEDVEIQEMQDEIERVYDDITSKHSWLPRSMRLWMAAAMTKDLNRQLTTMQRQRNVTYAEYLAEKEAVKTEFEFERMALEEEKQDRTERMNYLSSMFQSAKKDEDWEKQKQFEIQKLDEARRYWDEQAIKEHERNLEVLELGQDFQREEAEKQRGQAMEIVKMQMRGAWVNFSEEKEDENGRYVTVTDTKNGTVKNVYLDNVVIPEETIIANDGSSIGYGADNSWNFTIDLWPTGVVRWDRWQCWEVVNDISGIWMGNYYTEKLTKTQKWKKPQVGDVFVSPRWIMYNGKQTWHTGFVKTVFPDGSIELWESNFVKDRNGKGITSTRIIKPTDVYYKELQFWKTKLSRDWGAVNAGVDKKILDLALSNLAQRSEWKWDVEMTKADFARVVKDFWKWAPEVRDYLNNIIGSSKWQTESWNQMRNAINWMENVSKMLEEYQKKYGSSAFGVIGNINQKVSELQASLWGADINKDSIATARIKSQIAILLELQAYRKSVTGSAASELESKEYRELFPKSNDSVNVSLEKIQALRDSLKRREQNTQRDFLGWDSVYDAIIGGDKNFSSLNDSKYTTSNVNYSLPPSMQWLSSYLNN